MEIILLSSSAFMPITVVSLKADFGSMVLQNIHREDQNLIFIKYKFSINTENINKPDGSPNLTDAAKKKRHLLVQ